MKTEKTYQKDRIASFFSRSIKCSKSKIVVLVAILCISIIFPLAFHAAVHGVVVSAVANGPMPISQSCKGHVIVPANNICYPIFSPRLNVPIAYSSVWVSVTGEDPSPRPVDFH